jgi:translocation and assembly module TamA
MAVPPASQAQSGPDIGGDRPADGATTPVAPATDLAPQALAPLAADAPQSGTDIGTEQRPVTWQLRVDAPDDLAKLLLRYLDLARYQRIGQRESITRSELQRLRSATPAQARALLETQGYFAADVQVELRPLTLVRRAELSRLAALLTGRLLSGGAETAAEKAAAKPAASAQDKSPAASADQAGATPAAVAASDATSEADRTDAQSEIEVVVTVTAGPRTTVRSVQIEFEGPLERVAARSSPGQLERVEERGAIDAAKRQAQPAPQEAGLGASIEGAPSPRIAGSEPVNALDAEPEAAAAALVYRVRQRWGQAVGAAYTQPGWSDAKSSALSLLRAEGYAAASFGGSTAQVDAEAHQADLYLVIDSGPLYRYGELRFEGLDHVGERAVRALLDFSPGQPMREQPLLDYQDRLARSGLFDTISVTVDPEPLLRAGADAVAAASETSSSQSGNGAPAPERTPPVLSVPVVVRVRERPMDQLTLGVGYSGSTGPRVTAEHLNQSIFGWDWQAKTKLQLGRDAKLASLDLISHPQPGPYRNLASASIGTALASGLTVDTQKLRVGRSRDLDRIERLYYVEFLRASTVPSGGGVRDDNSSLAYTYEWIWRDLDNLVLPTLGKALSVDASLGHSFHVEADSDWFGRTTGRLTNYWPIGDSWYGQSRIQLGQVFSRPGVSVPFTLLFRAGGDESVRGYAYQSLGPADATGTALGGHVLATGSLEIARPIARSIPSVWGAAFIDAGNAADDWQSFHAAIGWGVGIRWRSPVGPLRIDLAYGEQVRRVRLHFSVGITF